MQIIVASESASSACIFIALALCLVLYTVVGDWKLQPGVVFTVVAVFNLVKSMLSLSVLGAGQYAQAMVSLDRLCGFLDRPNAESTMECTHGERSAKDGVSRHGAADVVQVSDGCHAGVGDRKPQFIKHGVNIITGEIG